MTYKMASVSALANLATISAVWVLQPLPLHSTEQSAVMWVVFAWAALGITAELLLVRSTEIMRRRLFHMAQVLRKQNSNGRDGAASLLPRASYAAPPSSASR